MSAYKRFKTQMTNLQILIAALEEVKPDWAGKMIVDPTGNLAPLGYQADDRTKLPKGHKNYAPKAVLIVPGEGSERVGRGVNAVGGASNDISVSRGADGKFEIIISDYDSSRYGEKFRKEVECTYGMADKLVKAIQSVGAANIKSGSKQVAKHPQWGQCIAIPMAVKVKKSELA